MALSMSTYSPENAPDTPGSWGRCGVLRGRRAGEVQCVKNAFGTIWILRPAVLDRLCEDPGDNRDFIGFLGWRSFDNIDVSDP